MKSSNVSQAKQPSKTIVSQSQALSLVQSQVMSKAKSSQAVSLAIQDHKKLKI